MNHRIFERTLRSLVFRGACLFECLEVINPYRFVRLRVGPGGLLPRGGSPQMDRLGLWVGLDWVLYYPRFNEMFPFLCPSTTCLMSGGQTNFEILTSNQVGLPAELKHINKRRKRN